MKEQIVTGKKFRILADVTNRLWHVISFWTKAQDVEFNDGTNAQAKLGNIVGISDSLTSTASNVAASAKAVKVLNDKVVNQIGNLNEQIINKNNQINDLNGQIANKNQTITDLQNQVDELKDNVSDGNSYDTGFHISVRATGYDNTFGYSNFSNAKFKFRYCQCKGLDYHVSDNGSCDLQVNGHTLYSIEKKAGHGESITTGSHVYDLGENPPEDISITYNGDGGSAGGDADRITVIGTVSFWK